MRVVDRLYTGPAGDVFNGLTSIRKLVGSVIQTPLVDAIMMAWLAIGIAVVLIVAFRMERRQDPRRIILTIALGHLWSLLCFYHLTNNMLLLAPAFFAIYAGGGGSRAGRYTMLGLIQVAMTIDVVPRIIGVLPAGLVHDVLANLNRIIVFAALGYVAHTLQWTRSCRPGVDIPSSQDGHGDRARVSWGLV